MPGGQWIILHQGSTIRRMRYPRKHLQSLLIYTTCHWFKRLGNRKIRHCDFFKTIMVVINHFNEENMKRILQDYVVCLSKYYSTRLKIFVIECFVLAPFQIIIWDFSVLKAFVRIKMHVSILHIFCFYCLCSVPFL